MNAKLGITLFPAVEGSGCGCGSSCEPRPHTGTAEAEELLHRLQAEFGEAIAVRTAGTRTDADLDDAVRTLGMALAAAGAVPWALSRRNLLVLLQAGGPFLTLDGTLLAHGVLPPLPVLRDAVRRALEGRGPRATPAEER